MVDGSQKEEVKNVLRLKLNEDRVKLWLAPYTQEDGKTGHIPQELVDRYSSTTGFAPDVVMEVLEELRCHALEKLASKKKFEHDGVATLRVKLAGNVALDTGGQKIHSIQVAVGNTGRGLRTEVAVLAHVDVDRLKLVSAGRLIEDNGTLNSQGIKNNSLVLAICMGESEAEARRQEEQSLRLQKTREAAQLLADKNDEEEDSGYYLQIADQTGKPLDLPKEERKALVLAMTLHDKGKATVKRKDYAEGLLLLLEADKEFQKCRADILNAVDNYALVCLDIVWCYLCLKNVAELPDADVRLKACEECFMKSYGPNLERLALVKGGTGSEKALYMRLHLLQAIVAFHQNRKQDAHRLLNRAESELKELTVDEDQMTQVMGMGFTQQEARLGLRLCLGNVQMAVAHIMKRREDKKEMKEKEEEEKKKKRVAKKLGKTADGNNVNVDHYNSLVAMGFSKGAAAEALRQANNNLEAALQVLQDHPELLQLPDPEPPQTFKLTDEMIAQVTSLGFDEYHVRSALAYFHDVDQAIEGLISGGGEVQGPWVEALQRLNEAVPAPSTSAAEPSSSNSSPDKSQEERRREKDLMDTILPDIAKETEEHLDLTLEEERQFLEEYKAYLQSLHG